MKLLTLLALAAIVTLSSCQKEISLDLGQPPGPGSNTNSLLSRMVLQYPADSLIETFTYDASNRLISVMGEGDVQLSPASSLDGSFKILINRNGSGNIISITNMQPAATGGGFDTTYSTFYYTGGGANPAYEVSVGSDGSRDSIVFTYTGTRITAMKQYFYNNTSSSYDAYYSDAFTYDAAGNMTLVKSYDIQGAAPLLVSEGKFKYDTKSSALELGNEAILLKDFFCFSGPGNFFEIENISYDPAGNYTEKSSFTTTALHGNQPSICTGSEQFTGIPVSIPVSIKYYYK